ncbi:MAG: hypothetical protein RMK52_04565 [Chitinophagales bacterium]|nr:hypothetical protein [Chitinophagales bacterium]MDW8393499.1 hypothetical protein [Chitinophagales bacterium]
MHNIEPFYNWRDAYTSEDDERSPFYQRTYDEFTFTHAIYNYLIHPQWDYFGSPTLYLKILFTDYVHRICVMELLGEWNDAIHNDIMFLKREVLDVLIRNGICKFVLIGENVLNFHESDDCYYEEWYEDIKEDGGWIALINFREHVLTEMRQAGIHHFVLCGQAFNEVNWRSMRPYHILRMVENRIQALPDR